MQRMKEDYNSSKWCRGGRMLVAPSFSRTHLSERLALNFKGNQRERWLDFSTSSAPPSVVPHDPDMDTRLPSLEERRGKFAQNRASYFRIKACPPDYVLNPRHYRSAIERNRHFAQTCKTFRISPLKTPTGESFHSFMLGARFSDIRHVDLNSVKRWDLLIPRKEVPDPLLPTTTGPNSKSSSSRPASRPRDLPLSSGNSSTAVIRQKPYSAATTRTDEQQQPSLFIRVEGSNPQSPKPPSRPSSRALSGSQAGSGRTSQVSFKSSTPEIRVTSSPLHLKKEFAVSTDLKEGEAPQSDDASPVEAIEDLQVQIVKETSEGDFISPQAQKLAGEILEESHYVEDTVDNIDDNNTDSLVVQPSNAATQSAEEDNTVAREGGVMVDTEHQAPADHDAVLSETPEDGGLLMEVASPPVNVPQEEANHMNSRSSTIFVDMSNLSIQKSESNSTAT